MEESSSTKYTDNEGLPFGMAFEQPGQYEKNNKSASESEALAALAAISPSVPREKEPAVPSFEEMGRLVVPSAIWTAGVLYYTYFIGEEMHLFDVADVLVTRWMQGKLDAVDERTVSSLDRLLKKRERRISAEERALLYKRVFNFGKVIPESYMTVNEAFSSDWNRLMKGVAAYPINPAPDSDETVTAARKGIFQATSDLQYHLSEAMAGTAYMMAAEVFTLLREASDLLRNEEIIRAFGVPGLGINSVIEHIAAEEFNLMVPVELLTMLAESGSHILQEWVAKFSQNTYGDSMLHTLLIPAQEWRFAKGRVPGQ